MEAFSKSENSDFTCAVICDDKLPAIRGKTNNLCHLNATRGASHTNLIVRPVEVVRRNSTNTFLESENGIVLRYNVRIDVKMASFGHSWKTPGCGGWRFFNHFIIICSS